MAMDAYDVKSSEPGMVYVDVRLLGAGTSTPSKVYGKGITVGRTGVGVYTLTFRESPGAWAGCTYGLDATTPANNKGHTVVCTKTSATVITVNLYDSGFLAEDLEAAEWLNLTLKFKRTSVS